MSQVGSLTTVPSLRSRDATSCERADLPDLGSPTNSTMKLVPYSELRGALAG